MYGDARTQVNTIVLWSYGQDHSWSGATSRILTEPLPFWQYTGCDWMGHQRKSHLVFAGCTQHSAVKYYKRACRNIRKFEEWRRTMEERGLRFVERRLDTWGAMNIKTSTQRSIYRRDSKERENTSWDRRWRMMENWKRKSPRVQSGWKNWKRVSGVLGDRKMNVNIKGKVYRTVVRPALVYGAETWALKKAHENILEVAVYATMDVWCYDRWTRWAMKE